MSDLRAMLEKQWQSRTIVCSHKVASWVRPVWMQTADPGPQNGRCGWVLPDPPRLVSEPTKVPANLRALTKFDRRGKRP